VRFTWPRQGRGTPFYSVAAGREGSGSSHVRRGIEIIGYDQENKRYFMHSFDSSGSMGVMQAHVEHDTWRFVGEYMRFTGGFRVLERVPN
jgi:hypothetical protein